MDDREKNYTRKVYENMIQEQNNQQQQYYHYNKTQASFQMNYPEQKMGGLHPTMIAPNSNNIAFQQPPAVF